jgi:hypothetical protein
MRRTTRDLLDEYSQADFTKRLHLYLQYRELRPEFVQTDQNEQAAKATRRMERFRRLDKLLPCCYQRA